MIDQSDKYLLMIEPQLKPTKPIDDELSALAERVWLSSEPGARRRGFHRCSCGAHSDNAEHVLPGGVITNSLMLHYVLCHRAEIPESEITKLRRIGAALLKE